MLREPWRSTLLGLAIWLAGALLLGFWFGHVAWWLIAALGIYLGHVLRQIYLIEKALRLGVWPQWPSTKGLWAELFGRITILRKKSRRRKKRYNQLLREIRESTGALADAGVLLNPEGQIVWFNRAATALLGLDRKVDLGQRIENLLRGAEFANYLSTPSPEGVLIPGVVADTDRLLIQIIPYGRRQSLLIARDVTRQELLEKSRRDFVANASHELRSPLTVIAGYLDALEESDELPSEWDIPVEEMQRQTERMTGILKDLLELSRLESAPSEAGDAFVDMPALIDRVVSAHAKSDGPLIEIETCAEAGLLGSEAELYSIVDNLIANAMRFTPADGKVVVSWAADDTSASLVVRDTGIGIPAEFLSRLTERFFRVDAGRSRDNGGTGLGLAIVKHALQRHGAELSVTSEVGEGAEFSCRFPIRRLVHRSV